MNECPKCGADFIDIILGDFQVTHDIMLVDIMATCTRCGAELNITY